MGVPLVRKIRQWTLRSEGEEYGSSTSQKDQTMDAEE